MLVSFFAACLVVAPSQVAADAADKPIILVLPIQAKGGVSQDAADLLTALVTASASEQKSHRIVALSDVQGAISAEQVRQLAACDSASCMAEIAGSLHAEELIVGNVGKLGEVYILTLSRIRARDAQTIGRTVEQTSGAENEIANRVPSAVAKLFGAPAPAPQEPPPRQSPPKAAPVRAEPEPISTTPSWLRPTVLAGAGGCTACGCACVSGGLLGLAQSVTAAMIFRNTPGTAVKVGLSVTLNLLWFSGFVPFFLAPLPAVVAFFVAAILWGVGLLMG